MQATAPDALYAFATVTRNGTTAQDGRADVRVSRFACP
jgi:hypothetical protein